MMTLLRFFILILIITSCAPKEQSESKISFPTYRPDSPLFFNADFQSYQGVSYNLDATDNVFTSLPNPSGSWVYSLQEAPAWMTIDNESGLISGIPQEQGVTQFQVMVVDSLDPQTSYTSDMKSIAVNGDPLREHQWHLKNTGQKTFAISGGVNDMDINLGTLIEDGYSGLGIKVAISDSGGEINHDDLYQNIIEGASKDYTLDSPYLGNPVATTAHGTAVAGLIGARGWNNIGVAGVAPKVGMAIFQFLESSQSLSILVDQASGDFDIFNYSYGDTLFFDTESDPFYIDHLKYQTLYGRNAKGSIYVKAAGNEYLMYDNWENPNYCVSHNANFPFENESPYLIVIGAINADGERASYSSTGSNIWVSAPGGEYGFQHPAMLTTDLPTCFKGYSKAMSLPYNDFEYGHELNQKCNYTSTMNGTSSATPVATGAMALILEANPNLTQRDLKHILAMTARKVDLSSANSGYGLEHPSSNEQGCADLSLANHSYELGWTQNHEGIKYNNLYGFGLIDVEKAVALAKNFALDPLLMLPMPDLEELNHDFNIGIYSRSSLNLSIPDNSASGVEDEMNVSSSLTVESVQVKVQVTHPASGQIGIELKSPNGTRSILMNINNSFLIDGDSDLNIVLTTHAFYGENANGKWTIKVIDGLSGSTGKLNRWDINILGH